MSLNSLGSEFILMLEFSKMATCLGIDRMNVRNNLLKNTLIRDCVMEGGR